MKKCHYLYLISLFVLFPFLLYSLIVVMPSSNWHGFGVDSSHRIYVGKQDRIIQFEGGIEIGSISIPKYKTYYFTVEEDDTIIVATSTEIDRYTLTGKLIETSADKSSSKYNHLQWAKEVQTSDGASYRVTNLFGYRTILRNDQEIVYRTPVGEYTLRLLGFASFGIVALSIVLLCVSILPKKQE